jgi:uncharacterized protein
LHGAGCVEAAPDRSETGAPGGAPIAPARKASYLSWMTSPDGRRSNRLIHETSPYLLQHARNPVDWYAWGPEALARSKNENKPILLSIGYAACHWCHVMERESFENDAIAGLMNQDFVCIKVDREERPDLDDIYMAATVAMSGSGGWPMTVFLTPEQEPFFAGTYFPPEDKYGRPGFGSLLQRIAELWKNDRAALERQARELTAHVREQTQAARPAAIEAHAIDKAQAELSANYDPRWGGFGRAPKFPAPAALSLLLRQHLRTEDPRSLEMVIGTLNGMKNGGIYDHLGGGFARYATDERWLVPHFEKMLYDNAQLSRVYLEAYQVTRDDEYRRVASETLDYVLREMQDEAGGYYSATDADSEGEEGKFFVWTPDEIRDVLGNDAADAFCLYYDVTPEGNWERRSILNTPRPKQIVAGELGIGPADLEASLTHSRALLYEARKQRVPPLLDDKVLVSWNALMISAMAEGARVLGDDRYLASAERAARYIVGQLRRPDGGLYRTARAGKAHLEAYLEDYAYLSFALIDLYEAGGSSEWLRLAETLVERMTRDFSDTAGGAFFHTAAQHEQLLVRTREGHDGAIPNPNAIAAAALARLSHHLDRERYRELAVQAIRAYGGAVQSAPRAFATSLSVADFLLEAPAELVFVGERSDPSYRALWRAVADVYLPNRIIGHLTTGESDAGDLPLVSGKSQVDGRPALYVCKNFTCQAPVTDPERVPAALDSARGPRTHARLAGKQLPGRATTQATAAFAARFGELGAGYTALGATGLTTSRIGFGGYRIGDVDPTHRAALEHAVLNGINLIDTSTNYTDGRSESLIGEVIADLVRGQRLTRDQIIVVSKIGYVQGQNLELAKARAVQGRPFPEMVQYGDELWHGIHPEWLEDQLTRSLERLGLETLDVCLLHNPEYYLSHAAKHGSEPLAERRRTFYARVAAAFAHFEREVTRGRLAHYGVSSNTAGASAEDPEATELTRLLAAARQAGGEGHHFRVLQLPLNLVESDAVFEKSNAAATQTVLESALTGSVAVLVNRPLNAIRGGRLTRLADPPELGEAPAFDTQIARVQALETEFREAIAKSLRTEAASVTPDQFFTWATRLRTLPARLESYEQWQEIENHSIAPQVGQLLHALDDVLEGETLARFRDWRGRYVVELERLFASLRKRAADRSRLRADRLHQALSPALGDSLARQPLSQLAQRVLLGTPGVTAVLLGMRQPAYVDDALASLRAEPVSPVQAIYEAVRAADVV